MVESILASQKNMLRRRYLVYKFGLKGSTDVLFWSDGTVTLTGIVKEGFIAVSWRVSQFIELKIDSPLEAIINAGQDSIHCNLIIRKRTVNGKPVSYLIYEIADKNILKKSNKGKKVSIEFLTEYFPFTPLLQTISGYTNKGGNPESLRLFLEEPHIAKKTSTKTKIAFISKLILHLTKNPVPKIEIPLLSGETLTLFDDPVIAVQFTTNATSTSITLPKALDYFLTEKDPFIFWLRNDVLIVSKIYFQDYGKSITVSSHGKVITLLWGGGLVKPKCHSKLIDIIENHPEAERNHYLGLLQLSHRPDYHLLQETFYSFIEGNLYLPIMKENAQTSKHADELFAQKVQDILIKSPQTNSFLFEEAKLNSFTTNFHKIVDWFLVLTNPILKCYTFELRTLTNFDHKTKKLKQTIAEYAYLHEQIPEAGQPVIIVNWIITEQWRYYAGLFGIVLLDKQNIETINSFQDFLNRLLCYQNRYLYKHKSLKIANIQNASQLISKALAQRFISREMIQQYSKYLEITIDSFKSLLTFFPVMNTAEAINRYHDKKSIIIDNLEQLLQLHHQLISGRTDVIVEEELVFCQKRLAKSSANPDLALHSHSVINRRRWTYNIPQLQFLADNLSLLYSFRTHWSPLEPLRINLYTDTKNDGRYFEELVYRLLQANGYQTIRNVVVRIGPVSQEIDLVSFNLDASNRVQQRILISCTDKSTIQKSALKGNIKLKFYSLLQIVKYHLYAYQGLLFVYVPNTLDDYLDELIEDFQELVSEDIDIIFVGKEEFTLRSVSSSNCHREVSFESIYIVGRFFNSFTLYVYRKITIRLEIIEKKKRREKRLIRVFYFILRSRAIV